MSGENADGDWLDLADAITLLRDQIAEAQRRVAVHGDRDVKFELGEITLELGVELARSTSAHGGLRFSVASLGGKREKADKATHKMTVRINPGGASGPVNVGDKE